MRIFLSLSSFLLTGVVFLFLSQPTYAKVVINEFVSSGGTDWVELYSDTLETDLSIYHLVDESGNTKELSGSITAGGFSTVDWSNRLNDSGDTIKLLVISNESIVDEIIYGNNNLPSPELSQSAGRSPDGGPNWVIFSSPTKAGANLAQIVTPTNTPTATPTNAPTSTKTPTPTSTPKPTATSTPTPTPKVVATNTVTPTRKLAEYPTTKPNIGKLSTSTISPAPTAVLGTETSPKEVSPTTLPTVTPKVMVNSASSTPLQQMLLIGMGVLTIITGILGGYIYKQSRNHL